MSDHSGILNNEIVDELIKKAAENKNKRLPNIEYISLTYMKMMVRRFYFCDWCEYTIDLVRKRKFGTFYSQHFGSGSPHWKASKTVTAKRTHSTLIQLKIDYDYYGSYLAKRTDQSERCFNGCRAK